MPTPPSRGPLEHTPVETVYDGLVGRRYEYVVNLREVNEAYHKFLAMYDRLDYDLKAKESVSGRAYTLPLGIPSGYRYMGGFSMNIEGLNTVAKNLNDLAEGVARQIRLRFIEIVRKILLQAVTYAPVESGQLRQSAKATVGTRLVAIGTNSGTTAGIREVTPSRKTGWASDALTLNISFSDEGRTRYVYRNKKGQIVSRGARGYPEIPDNFLVSTFTHENLEYRGYVPGTGAKYLERAFMEALQDVLTEVKKGVELGMKEVSGGYWRGENG